MRSDPPLPYLLDAVKATEIAIARQGNSHTVNKQAGMQSNPSSRVPNAPTSRNQHHAVAVNHRNMHPARACMNLSNQYVQQ